MFGQHSLLMDILSIDYIVVKIYLTFHVAELTLNPPEGIIAGPVNEENFFEWEALIM